MAMDNVRKTLAKPEVKFKYLKVRMMSKIVFCIKLLHRTVPLQKRWRIEKGIGRVQRLQDLQLVIEEDAFPYRIVNMHHKYTVHDPIQRRPYRKRIYPRRSELKYCIVSIMIMITIWSLRR